MVIDVYAGRQDTRVNDVPIILRCHWSHPASHELSPFVV